MPKKKGGRGQKNKKKATLSLADFNGTVSTAAHAEPEPEKRVDAQDGEAYTLEEFEEVYGGAEEWDAAIALPVVGLLPPHLVPAQWHELAVVEDKLGCTVAHHAARCQTSKPDHNWFFGTGIGQDRPGAAAVAYAAAANRADPAAALAAALAAGFPYDLLPTPQYFDSREYIREPWEHHPPPLSGGCYSALLVLRRLLRPTAAVDEDGDEEAGDEDDDDDDDDADAIGSGPACCSVMAAAALITGDAVWLRTALAAEPEKRVDARDGQAYTREEFEEVYGGTEEWDACCRRAVADQLAQLSGMLAPASGAWDAPCRGRHTIFSLLDRCRACVAAVKEECALLAAQQRLAFAVALFASGSRLKRREPRGLAAVLSTECRTHRLYEVLAGGEDQPLAPPDTVVGTMPALAPLRVAERAAAEGGWAWQVAQVRAEVARLQAELGL